MSALVFDVLAVCAFLGFGIYGWIAGFMSSVYAFVGALIGIFIEYFTMPLVLSATENAQLRFVVGVIYGFVVVSMCSLGAEVLGLYMRDRMGLQKSRISRLAGVLLKVMLAAVLVWVFFSPLSVQPNSSLGRTMGESKVWAAVNLFAPRVVQRIPQMLDISARTSSLQQMQGRSSQWAANAGVPDPSILQDPDVARARDSVVKIEGDASDCHRMLEGTGFVFSPGLVVTNAHVVAGARSVAVFTVKGHFRGVPIVFDPMRDVAVLWVPDIASSYVLLPALLPVPSSQVDAGQAMAVPGFPNNGPYRVEPGRVLEHFILRGPGIYGTTLVDRKAFALVGALMSGNSGGPVLDERGRYVGMVFGVVSDRSDTAYALTVEEMEPVLQRARTTRSEVSTGRCVAMESDTMATVR